MVDAPRVCVRPVIVRFTEPTIDDVHLSLVYERDGSAAYETVRDVKHRIAEEVPSVSHNRLRLIYFGRVLADGVRLGEWLDSLDAKQGTAEDAIYDRILVEPWWISSSDFVLRTVRPAERMSEKQRGKQRQPPGWDGARAVDALRLPAVHIQCSVGPVVDDSAAGADDQPQQPVEPQVRGFDRLQQSAGLNAADVERMRAEFRESMGLFSHSGDVLRAQDEEEHIRALEEQWIENGAEAVRSPEGPRWSIDAAFGLMVGFFFPILPLLFVSDGRAPQRSSRRVQRRQEQQEQPAGQASTQDTPPSQQAAQPPSQQTQPPHIEQWEIELEQTVAQLTQALDERDAARQRGLPNPPENAQQTRQLIDQLTQQLSTRLLENAREAEEADDDEQQATALSARIMRMQGRNVVFSSYAISMISLATLANIVFGVIASL
ncbi:hypothetical protein MCUN1_003042 [Malassezia cuniculi]|uniref:Ubiquitin-like domain-containing protein n=1 Tax=Malassezia cuniculi TaxID=948313 RepID=A0AAF0JCQ8_9BASI|nr:hypothetical protein MCUN1_003042 [Malassezia cuniculi]